MYRKAKPTDIEKYEEAKAKEHATMVRSRQIAADLGLNMKIGDVEYQGMATRLFSTTSQTNVDFRQLIKVLAEAFRVRIEMKQIGARQEAVRIGGITLRTRTLLFQDDQLRFWCRPLPGYFHEPAEARRTMCKIEMLYQL